MKGLKGVISWLSAFLFAVAVIAVYKTFDNFDSIWAFVGTILDILSPFVTGFGLAFLLFAPSRFLENKLAGARNRFLRKGARPIAIAVVYLALLLIVAVILIFALPALAYAPPYSSAKDPVNMAGYVIGNVLDGLVKQFHWDEVDSLPRDGSVTLLDVRTPEEFAQGHIGGAVNIPVDELRQRLGELDPAKPVYVNCQSGLRSYLACRILTQCGFTCAHLSGGYGFYQAVTQEQQRLGSIYPCGIEKV